MAPPEDVDVLADRTEEVALRDGSTVLVRPIARSDGDLLAVAFRRLSPTSRRRRFLTTADELTSEDISYLTDVDHRRHEALVALDPANGDALGVARYVRVPGDRESAEVAVAVIDEWQNRGIATVLLDRLTERARANGLRRYTALVSTENSVVIEALERIGAARFGLTDEGEIEYGINFPAQGISGRLRGALEAAATGQLDLLTAITRRLTIWRRD
ncbi:MAG: hypothetical protein NVS2B6_08430 [Thermoleophilaceae bacterium]